MVELYGADNCFWCRKTNDYLDAKGVRFRTKNITDPDNAHRAFTLTGQQTVPITVIGRTAVVGFDPDAIDRALNRIE